MKQPSWTLDNAVEIQKESPYTFYRPSEAILDRLEAGDSVKLIFNFEPSDPDIPSGERMWVKITHIANDSTFTGTLDNDPYYIEDLKADDIITFKRKHIIQYSIDRDIDDLEDINAGKLDKYLKKCFVSNHIMHEHYKVGRLYREEPYDEEDSGWTFMSDYETQAYVDDTENLQYIALGKVLNLDDSFIHLLDEPAGSNFARDEATGTYFLIETE